MNYKEKLKKLNLLDEFINGEDQDDILLVLDKIYKDDVWSIICAVKQWFEVVKKYLNSEKVLKNNSNDNNWGNVYLYISAIDITTKGINNLYNILNTDNKKYTKKLFYGKNNIFKDKKDDNSYFQNIRAIFGAHPTNLEGNENFIVGTYPTPCNNNLNNIQNNHNWDYYTLLWSGKKSDGFIQKEFGFNFNDLDRFLDQYLNYIDTFINEIKKMINTYKEEISNKIIELPTNTIEKLRILKEEDKQRLNKRYSYIIDDLITLLSTNIDNKINRNKYDKFKKIIEDNLYILEDAIQKPNYVKNIKNLESLINMPTIKYDNMSHYYYSKLIEYNNNIDMEKILILYYKNKLNNFNEDIHNIRELYCLVIAENYFNNEKRNLFQN